MDSATRNTGRKWMGRMAFALPVVFAPAVAQAAGQPLPTHAQALAAVHRTQLASPYRLSRTERAGRIRYTLAIDSDVEWTWPQTREQKVSVEDGNIRVTVCADCDFRHPADAVDPSTYLAANDWVDSDSPEVLAFARAHAYGIRVTGNRVARQMRMLVEAIQEHMTGGIDFRAYDPASQALRTRSGDCTEYAVLLAAAARARGIPARLVYGLAYASRFTGETHVFSPHVWVQAWDGQRWTSYDAGLGEFDAGHIALHVGDGSTGSLGTVMRFMQQLRLIDAVGIRIVDDPALSAASTPR